VAMSYLTKSLGKTKAQKLLMLAEIEYFAQFGTRLTELSYVSYDHGPFSVDLAAVYDDLIEDERIECVTNGKWEGVKPTSNSTTINIAKERLGVFQSVCKQFGNMDTAEIMREVYRFTVYASTPFGQEIDFSIFTKETIKDQIPLEMITSSKEKQEEESRIKEMISKVSVPEFF